jgi:hypothetical protein
MTLMSQTYRDALAVLVLDRELQRLDTAMISILEQDIVLAFVGWTRRLWTLQEAALAKKLYIQTLHISHKLEHEKPIQSKWQHLLSQICFQEDITAFTRSRIPSMMTLTKTILESSQAGPSTFPISTNMTVLQRLALAVQHRTTSKVDDEPLILATTLGLSIDPILSVHERDARMAALFVLVHDIPADIIFDHTWKRITNAPFRWAPRTLLGFPRLQLHATFGTAALCDERGLHACYQGFVADVAAGGIGWNMLQLGIEEQCYAIDEASGMKYEFQPSVESGQKLSFPKKCALLFRALGNAVAVASIAQEGQMDKEDEIEVSIVGHCTVVGSGAGLEIAEGRIVLKGVLTTNEQRWRVT